MSTIPLKTWAELSDDDARRVSAELAVLGQDASAPSVQRRVGVAPDGRLFMSVRYPRPLPPYLGHYLEQIWLWPEGCTVFAERFHPAAAAVELMTSETGPEAEVRRRQKLYQDHQAAEQAQRQERERREQENQARARIEAQRRRDLGEEEWQRLDPGVQALYHLAQRETDLARAESLVALADLARRNGGRLPLPDREWRSERASEPQIQQITRVADDKVIAAVAEQRQRAELQQELDRLHAEYADLVAPGRYGHHDGGGDEPTRRSRRDDLGKQIFELEQQLARPAA